MPIRPSKNTISRPSICLIPLPFWLTNYIHKMKPSAAMQMLWYMDDVMRIQTLAPTGSEACPVLGVTAISSVVVKHRMTYKQATTSPDC